MVSCEMSAINLGHLHVWQTIDCNDYLTSTGRDHGSAENDVALRIGRRQPIGAQTPAIERDKIDTVGSAQ